ncbi:F-box domain-containing protein [Favolaschia claudopus]|uniref:F-box domain-containing protein n=1 Tax=Favolaschia claudopus TaxID=2862362 RepID=A0AAW0EBU8_9AGAR
MQVRVAPECASKGHKSAPMDDQLAKAALALKNLESVFFNTPDPYGQLLQLRQDLRLMLSPPYQKLPSELWVKIFSDFTPVKFPLNAPDEPLHLVPQVCRAWRDLVSQCPQLSASISVILDGEEPDVARISRSAEQWLARAGDICPMDITAACAGAYAKTASVSPDLVSDFITRIALPRTNRLKHLELALPFQCLQPLFDLPRGSFSCLKILSLLPLVAPEHIPVPEAGYCRWHWPLESKAFESAPLLREVTYSPDFLWSFDEIEAMTGTNSIALALSNPNPVGALTTFHSSFAPRFFLPWVQLNSLHCTMTALTPDQWCSVLTHCGGMETLSIVIRPHSDGQQPLAPVRLQLLRSLYVAAYCGGGDDMLDRLVAPKLTSLTCIAPLFHLESVTSFQTRSNVELEYLGLGFKTESPDLGPFLENHSALTTIAFVVSEHFPTVVWERIGRCELLPNLTTLSVLLTALDVSMVVDIIESRWDNTDFQVEFLSVRPPYLQAVKDELKRLDRFGCAQVDSSQSQRRVIKDSRLMNHTGGTGR